MLPKGSKRVLTAGRSISADDACYSAIRVIPSTMAIGQAAVVAVALALKKGVTLNELKGLDVSTALKNNGNRFDW